MSSLVKCDICNSNKWSLFQKRCYRCSNYFDICRGCDPTSIQVDREPIYYILCKVCQRDKKIEKCLD